MKFATLSGKVTTEDPEENGISEYNFIHVETSIYKRTTQEQLDTCDHDPDENNKCKKCFAVRVSCGENAPRWISGSVNLMTINSGINADLVLPLITLKGLSAKDAVFNSGIMCERCMNSIAYELGLDNSYPEFGEVWRTIGTSCVCCRDEEADYTDQYADQLKWNRFKNKIKTKIIKFIGEL